MEYISYRSANGTDTIQAAVCRPPSSVQQPPKAIVQIVHGMCEHMGRYAELMQTLAEQGFAVCGEDHLGHGRSAGKDGLGYFAPQNGWKYLVQDTRQLTILMQGQYPDLPVFLLGHSMGSFIAREYMAEYGTALSGVLLSGTGGANPLQKPGLALVQGLKLAKGGHYRSTFVNNLAFGSFGKAIKNPRTPSDWLTRDCAEVDRYLADPLCSFIFTLSAYEDLLRLTGAVSGKPWAQRVPKNLPVLLYSGDQDPVGNFGAGVRQVYGWLTDAGVREVQIKLYPQGRHEMHNELNRDEVYADILQFLHQHIGQSTK